MCLGLNVNNKIFDYNKIEVQMKIKNNKKKVILSKNI